MLNTFIHCTLLMVLPFVAGMPNMTTEEAALYQIMLAESGGDPTIKLHPDKTSYGLFGLTKMACDEVGEEWPPESPEDELRAARAYLRLMAQRHDTNSVEATQGWYHGGTPERRAAYIAYIATLAPDEKTLKAFMELCRGIKITEK